MNPLIRIRMAQLLARKYNLEAVKAVDLAEELEALFKSGNLDVVLDSWVSAPPAVQEVDRPVQRPDFWDGVANAIDRLDEYGDWHPWRP